MVDLKKCATLEIARHSLDEELAFRIRSRRNRLLGLWAANRLGLNGDAAQDYARRVVSTGIEQPGDEALVQRIAGDVAKSGVVLGQGIVRAEMERLSRIAALEYAAAEPPSRPWAA